MKTGKSLRLIGLLGLALTLPSAMMVTAQIDPSGGGRDERPCDIYAAGGTPCVAAHSTTRALYRSYSKALYQVRRDSDGRTLDIGVVPATGAAAGGYADAAAQDAFCAGTLCRITIIYDQSGNGNDLRQAPPGTFNGPAKGGFNELPIADMAPVTVMGHKAYGAYIMPGMGLRNNDARGLAINDEPEGMYYVIDGTHYSSGCCFDYGNASTNSRAVGTGTMETTYFGTATAWGSGNGDGPWIMADMEAGLFSGYNAKKNDVPTIDKWRFVTAVVDGGGGNKWDLRGGNAQEGTLTTYYSGVRPGSPESDRYFPMHKKGAVLLGNGGDNGNGSAGTFYEGVMTTGYPSEATTDAVQANIVAARYDVPRVTLSRLTTFTPGAEQQVKVTYTNTTGVPAKVKLSAKGPQGWTVAPALDSLGSSTGEEAGPIAPGASGSFLYQVSAPQGSSAGFVTATAEWTRANGEQIATESYPQRVRSVPSVKINEVRLGSSANASNQFIELYNAGEASVDLSGWKLINTRSEWAPVELGTIPEGTKLAAKGFYLLGLADSGLVAPAAAGDKTILVGSTTGFEAGQEIEVDGEKRKIVGVGAAAGAMTTLFIPVSTGPWLTFPAGTTNLPVTSSAGFAVGQKIGIDAGGQYEVATVTRVGKGSTQTTLVEAAKAGATRIKVEADAEMTPGDTLTIDTGARTEEARVKAIVTTATAPVRGFGGFGGRRGGGAPPAPGEVELEAPLKLDHMTGVDVSDRGTGISFAPATRFPHRSGDAAQALGGGLTLDAPLERAHTYGAPVVNATAMAAGYEGGKAPDQWFGGALSASAGSVALMDASGKVVVDAIVYGSQQSSSSANGTIASPELATLEGVQSQGGCIAVAPQAGGRGFGGRFGQRGGAGGEVDKSLGRSPDGADSDMLCDDFHVQTGESKPTPGAANAY